MAINENACADTDGDGIADIMTQIMIYGMIVTCSLMILMSQ